MSPNLPDTYQGALRSIEDRSFLLSPKYREQSWRADWTNVDDRIQEFSTLLVRRMANLGVPMFVSEARRSAKRQRELKAKGFSKLTNGPHMHGMAVDIIHSTKAWDISRKAWDLVGHVGKEIAVQKGYKLTWGGDWSNPWDPAHWEIKDWRKEAAPW